MTRWEVTCSEGPQVRLKRGGQGLCTALPPELMDAPKMSNSAPPLSSPVIIFGRMQEPGQVLFLVVLFLLNKYMNYLLFKKT